jgi:hypothetical protein
MSLYPLPITGWSTICALGQSRDEIRAALAAGETGLGEPLAFAALSKGDALRGHILPTILIALTAGACATLTRVENPTPVQASPDQRSTADAIRQALRKRQWSISNERSGAIHAVHEARGLRLDVEIIYDARAVSVRYLHSSNLQAEQRGEDTYASPTVNKWMNNLQSDIYISLSRYSAPPPVYQREPPREQPPEGPTEEPLNAPPGATPDD